MTFMLIPAILLFAFVLYSQWTAHTPVILGADGDPLPGSIASLEKVKLGGVDQWLIIHGHDVNKPVLLFLSGGPGASEAARVLRFNAEKELIFFEDSGHGMIWQETDKFHNLMVNTILPETYH
jgi:pimeloyl-ACP methyl ester carboxylesterase